MENSRKEPADINDLIKIINNPQHETDVELLAPYPSGSHSDKRKENEQEVPLES